MHYLSCFPSTRSVCARCRSKCCSKNQVKIMSAVLVANYFISMIPAPGALGRWSKATAPHGMLKWYLCRTDFCQDYYFRWPLWEREPLFPALGTQPPGPAPPGHVEGLCLLQLCIELSSWPGAAEGRTLWQSGWEERKQGFIAIHSELGNSHDIHSAPTSSYKHCLMGTF